MIYYMNELEEVLSWYKIDFNDICFVSSVSFAEKNIRDNKDIEFVVRPEKRAIILKKRRGVIYNAHSGVLKFGNNIQCVIEPYRMFNIYDENLFEDKFSELLSNGSRVINLEIYLAKKILQNRIKDEQDILLVKEMGLWSDRMEGFINNYLDIAAKNGFILTTIDRQQKWEQIFNKSDLYIFGTGAIGKNVFNKVKREGLSEKITGFLVSKKNNNTHFEGKEIFEISEIDKQKSTILIAVEYSNMMEIKSLLIQEGFLNLEEAYMFWE